MLNKYQLINPDSSCENSCCEKKMGFNTNIVPNFLQIELENYFAPYKNLPFFCLAIDPTGLILAINQTGAESLGYLVEELIVHPQNQQIITSTVQPNIFKLIQEKYHQSLLEKIRLLCQKHRTSVEKSSEEWEICLVEKTGKNLWIKAAISLLSIAKKYDKKEVLNAIASEKKAPNLGQIILLIGQNITEYKEIAAPTKVENSLRIQSEEILQQLSSAVEQTADSVVITDRNGIIEYVNPAFEQITGYTAIEAISQTPAILKSGKHDKSFYQELWRTLKTGLVFRSIFINRHKNGKLFYEEKTITPIRDVSGVITHFVSTAKDITERKRSEVLLRQQTERERLMSSITQRIRQSLNLAEILNTTVAEVRQFLETDRVLIYQFEPDLSGTVVVESVAPNWLSIQGTLIKDICFSEKYIFLYQQGRVRAIDDIYHSGLNPCHTDLLAQFQVKANLVVPILQSTATSINREAIDELNHKFTKTNESPSPNRLWGLLIAHHCQTPRAWESLEIDLLKQLANQLAIAIQQSSLFQQLYQAQTNLEKQVNQRTTQLQQALNFAAGLQKITDKVRDSLDESQILQTAVQQIANVLKIDYCGAILYNQERTTATIRYESTQPELGSAIGQTLAIVDSPWVHHQLQDGEVFTDYNLRSKVNLNSRLTNRNKRFYPQLQVESGDLACPSVFSHLAAKLLCPISDDRGAIGYLAAIHQTHRYFEETEIQLVQQVANQCAIAIRQARLFQSAQTQVEELRKLSLLKDDFLSTVSHELRTPMTNIKMGLHSLTRALQLQLAKKELNFSLSERYLQILQTECEREISLINDLLDLQSLDAGARPITISQINLLEWISKIVQPFVERAQKRSQIFQVDIDSDLPLLFCDPTSLDRILVELLNNACKYTPPNEKIDLKVMAKSDQLRLQVINSGIEIAQSEQSRIFDKFYRIPSADPWKQGGTGLGLALVQKLTEHLGGTINVYSKNCQTCFTVELPLMANA